MIHKDCNRGRNMSVMRKSYVHAEYGASMNHGPHL